MKEKIKKFFNKDDFIALVKRTVEVYSKHEMGVYSGNATFYLMISFVPLLMMIIYVPQGRR